MLSEEEKLRNVDGAPAGAGKQGVSSTDGGLERLLVVNRGPVNTRVQSTPGASPLNHCFFNIGSCQVPEPTCDFTPP